MKSVQYFCHPPVHELEFFFQIIFHQKQCSICLSSIFFPCSKGHLSRVAKIFPMGSHHWNCNLKNWTCISLKCAHARHKLFFNLAWVATGIYILGNASSQYLITLWKIEIGKSQEILRKLFPKSSRHSSGDSFSRMVCISGDIILEIPECCGMFYVTLLLVSGFICDVHTVQPL